MPFTLSKDFIVEDKKKLEDFKEMYNHLQRSSD